MSSVRHGRVRWWLLAGLLAVPCPTRGEIPLAPADPAGAIRWAFAQADTITVDYYEPGARHRSSIDLRPDAVWRREVERLLAKATFAPRPHCFCMTPPLVFFREGQRLATLSVHHREKVRLAIDPHFGDLNGDFFVGETVGMGLVLSAHRRRETMQAIRASAEAAAAAVLNR